MVFWFMYAAACMGCGMDSMLSVTRSPQCPHMCRGKGPCRIFIAWWSPPRADASKRRMTASCTTTRSVPATKLYMLSALLHTQRTSLSVYDIFVCTASQTISTAYKTPCSLSVVVNSMDMLYQTAQPCRQPGAASGPHPCPVSKAWTHMLQQRHLESSDWHMCRLPQDSLRHCNAGMSQTAAAFGCQHPRGFPFRLCFPSRFHTGAPRPGPCPPHLPPPLGAPPPPAPGAGPPPLLRSTLLRRWPFIRQLSPPSS